MSCTYWSGPCMCVAECARLGCRDTRAAVPPAPSELFDHAHPDSWKYEAQSAPGPAVPPATEPAPPFTPDLVEERLNSWRQRTMNRSGDRLALDDFMGQESIDDLIDFVCAPAQVSGEERAMGAAPDYPVPVSVPRYSAWHTAQEGASTLPITEARLIELLKESYEAGAKWALDNAALQARPPLEGE